MFKSGTARVKDEPPLPPHWRGYTLKGEVPLSIKMARGRFLHYLGGRSRDEEHNHGGGHGNEACGAAGAAPCGVPLHVCQVGRGAGLGLCNPDLAEA